MWRGQMHLDWPGQLGRFTHFRLFSKLEMTRKWLISVQEVLQLNTIIRFRRTIRGLCDDCLFNVLLKVNFPLNILLVSNRKAIVFLGFNGDFKGPFTQIT